MEKSARSSKGFGIFFCAFLAGTAVILLLMCCCCFSSLYFADLIDNSPATDTSDSQSEVDMTEVLNINRIEFKVRKVENLGSTISPKYSYMNPAVSKNGKFILITYTITNRGEDTIIPVIPKLIINSKEYSNFSQQSSYLNNAVDITVNINPDQDEGFEVLFDVPDSANEAKVQFTDSFIEGQKGFIDIDI